MGRLTLQGTQGKENDFVKLYRDALEQHGSVPQADADRINAMVADRLDMIFYEEDYDRSTLEAAMAAQAYNEKVLARFAVDDPADLPAYAQEQLMPEPKAFSEEEIPKVAKERRLDLYAEVMEVAPVLSKKTVDFLGQEYAEYVKDHTPAPSRPLPKLPEGYTNTYQDEDDWSFDEKG